MVLNWQKSELIPVVGLGDERLFWVAVEANRVNPHKQRNMIETHVVTFLAYYQNRPLQVDSDGESLDDDCLVNTDGEPVESVGWVSCKAHYEFDNFYEQLDFNDNYKLLGWAEYTPPVFTAAE